MKSLKILSFLLIGTIGVQTAFADDAIKFGIRAGLNMAKIENSGSYSYEGESFSNGTSMGKGSSSATSDESRMGGNLIGFQVGAVADIKITDFLYVQPGIMLSSKGVNTEEEYEREETGTGSSSRTYKEKSNYKVNPYYIDVPIMLSLKGTLADNLALRAQAGPYLGFGLFGGAEGSSSYTNSSYPDENESSKWEVKNVFSPTDEEKEESGEFIGGGLSRFNCGLSFGVGIEYSNFYLGVSYNYGLTSLVGKHDYEYSDSYEMMPGMVQTYSEKGTRETNVYERTLSITLGYNF